MGKIGSILQYLSIQHQTHFYNERQLWTQFKNIPKPDTGLNQPLFWINLNVKYMLKYHSEKIYSLGISSNSPHYLAEKKNHQKMDFIAVYQTIMIGGKLLL